MIELLSDLYLYTKSLHVMAVLSWMAGLFYLPRLFVYHAERAKIGKEPAASFIIMEDKLLRIIMRPAMIVTWLSGLCLVFTPGIIDWSLVWPWVKAACVIAMTWFHWWCVGQQKALAESRGLSGRWYRLMNELPTFLMVCIIVAVIIKY